MSGWKGEKICMFECQQKREKFQSKAPMIPDDLRFGGKLLRHILPRLLGSFCFWKKKYSTKISSKKRKEKRNRQANRNLVRQGN